MTFIRVLFVKTSHSQSPAARGQVRQGGVRPRERAPDYRVVAAWAAFLIFIGAAAFAVSMAIHNESLAA